MSNFLGVIYRYFRSPFVKNRRNTAFFRSMRDRTTIKNGSFGMALSRSIVLEAIAKNNKHSYEQLPWFSQSQSPLPVWHSKYGEIAFLPGCAGQNDHHGGIFWEQPQRINCAWCNVRVQQIIMWTPYLVHSVVIFAPRWWENGGKGAVLKRRRTKEGRRPDLSVDPPLY